MLENREGQKVPQVTFQTRVDGRWKPLTSAEVFDGRTVVLFALPGAFTPTCSTAHVPRYAQLLPLFRAAGVDTVACLSVNDAFVMDEWQVDQEASELLFLPDGNGEFSKGMGMLVDKSVVGFGSRSWRYSMLVRNGVIEKMFIEPDEPGDPFLVSDADTMLDYLKPGTKRPSDIVLFTRSGCSYCVKAKALLKEANLPYEDVPARLRLLMGVSGKRSTPAVFIDGKHIGGADELEAWLANGQAS